MLVFAMSTEHVLERLRDGQLCIAAGDRPEALITLAAAHAADGFPALAGVVLNGGYRPSDQVLDLVAGIGPTLPVILTPHDSYETARIVASTRGVLGRGTQRKIDTRSEEHTYELPSLMRISYAVLCLKKKKYHKTSIHH